MSRMLKIVFLLCAAAAVAAASPKKNPDIEQAIKSELVGKSFYTKILVGSYIRCPQSPRNDALKMVDTELTLANETRFFARANCFYPGGVFMDMVHGYVDGQLLGQIPIGAVVWVRGVDFKEDRVEVRLSMNNNDLAGGSGKIKYMVGSDYRTWSKDDLMQAIAMGLRIPSYERASELKSEFANLQSSLQAAESKFNSSGGTSSSKLADAYALRQVLEQLQKNRADFIAMGKTDPQPGIYTDKLKALQPEIIKLNALVHQEQVAHIREQLQAQLQDITKIQTLVRQKAPLTQAEWQQRSDALNTYATLLDLRQKLLDSLRIQNETPSPEDLKFLNDGKVEVDAARKSLEDGRQQIAVVEINSQFQQLTKKRAQMIDAYSRSFGTNKERSALLDLISVLDQIVANRERAAAAGNKVAATQLIQYRAESEKYKRK